MSDEALRLTVGAAQWRFTLLWPSSLVVNQVITPVRTSECVCSFGVCVRACMLSVRATRDAKVSCDTVRRPLCSAPPPPPLPRPGPTGLLSVSELLVPQSSTTLMAPEGLLT